MMGEPKEEEGSLEDSLQDSVVREALEGGLDLRDYSKWVLQKYELSSLLCCRQIEDELAAAEKASIADYISQSGNIAQLHNQVRWDLLKSSHYSWALFCSCPTAPDILKDHPIAPVRCRVVTRSLHEWKTSFSLSNPTLAVSLLKSLGEHSRTFKTYFLSSLQQQSVEMNLRLKNRQSVRGF